ncbi:DUF4266 domain-containing protein [Marinomonas sp. IMCC 4694]|uniref:DUF4266 domain-containing protein n=1 Tax=Marinomonas sp. IMCC 4694 TaxID=2605432 RepID=UPI0011E70AE5|nr:DUF4266 domain-containing protein [Marinomonas sp. IMCC 4694]TYL46633.1 DUF4266 domain-containing protein [Marinomonas sp. IMCC 4694]
MRKTISVIGLLALPIILSGCSDVGVKPWERDILAQQEMNLISDPIESSLNDHIYFSKEASSGGQGFGGGGCGCN